MSIDCFARFIRQYAHYHHNQSILQKNLLTWNFQYENTCSFQYGRHLWWRGFNAFNKLLHTWLLLRISYNSLMTLLIVSEDQKCNFTGTCWYTHIHITSNNYKSDMLRSNYKVLNIFKWLTPSSFIKFCL